jgi:glycosyltransferase involved in cell wall biosynthesis
MGLLALMTALKPHGGIPRFSRLFLRAAAEWSQARGSELRVLTLADSRPFSIPGAIESVACAGRRPLFVARAARWAPRARAILAGHVNLSPVAWGLSRAMGLRYGVVAHGIEVWAELPRSRSLALREADFVLAVSEYTAREVVASHGVREERVQVFPNALDPLFVEEAPAAAPVADALSILTVCRLDPRERYKGVDHLIRALPAVRARHPAARLVVVGDGPDRLRLEEIAHSLGVQDAIEWAGAVGDEELKRRYRDCAVFAMPSRKEGFGIVFLEAMSFGKPVIAARAGGAPEVVSDGETGLLVTYGDVEALAERTNRLLADPALRARLGEAGRRRVESEFSFDAMRRRLFDVLDRRVPLRGAA